MTLDTGSPPAAQATFSRAAKRNLPVAIIAVLLHAPGAAA
jgi:hypothetical protein